MNNNLCLETKWVLLEAHLTRFSSARALPLCSFENKKEKRNCFLCCYFKKLKDNILTVLLKIFLLCRPGGLFSVIIDEKQAICQQHINLACFLSLRLNRRCL